MTIYFGFHAGVAYAELSDHGSILNYTSLTEGYKNKMSEAKKDMENAEDIMEENEPFKELIGNVGTESGQIPPDSPDGQMIIEGADKYDEAYEDFLNAKKDYIEASEALANLQAAMLDYTVNSFLASFGVLLICMALYFLIKIKKAER